VYSDQSTEREPSAQQASITGTLQAIESQTPNGQSSATTAPTTSHPPVQAASEARPHNNQISRRRPRRRERNTLTAEGQPAATRPQLEQASVEEKASEGSVHGRQPHEYQSYFDNSVMNSPALPCEPREPQHTSPYQFSFGKSIVDAPVSSSHSRQDDEPMPSPLRPRSDQDHQRSVHEDQLPTDDELLRNFVHGYQLPPDDEPMPSPSPPRSDQESVHEDQLPTDDELMPSPFPRRSRLTTVHEDDLSYGPEYEP